jgi:hypothetical protein
MAFARLKKLDGRGATFITALSITPSIAMLVGVGGDATLAELVPAVGLVAYALVLGAAVLTYFHWRMISVNDPGGLSPRLVSWLTVGLVAGGVDGLLQVAPFDDGPAGTPDRWSMVSQLVLLLVLCLAAAVSERVEVPTDPALLGAVAALVVTGANALALRRWS